MSRKSKQERLRELEAERAAHPLSNGNGRTH